MLWPRDKTGLFGLNRRLRFCPLYLSVRNTGEAGEKPLRKRVERVVSRLFYNHALACGCLKAEEVFHGGKVRASTFLARTSSRTADSSGAGRPF